MQLYKCLHFKALQARIGVTCVITKVDLLDKEIADRTESVCTNQRVAELRQRVVREVGVAESQVRAHHLHALT